MELWCQGKIPGSSDMFIGVQGRKEFAYFFPQNRVDDIRRDFVQRDKYKAAMMHFLMWNRQRFRFYNPVFCEKDIDVDCPGFVVRIGQVAAKTSFKMIPRSFSGE